MPSSNPLASSTKIDYQPLYHKTINEQATGFVADMEYLLRPAGFGDRSFSFGPNDEYQAVVMNTNLAIWGMLPDSHNSPTDTVRCVFELEIHYPKAYDC